MAQMRRCPISQGSAWHTNRWLGLAWPGLAGPQFKRDDSKVSGGVCVCVAGQLLECGGQGPKGSGTSGKHDATAVVKEENKDSLRKTRLTWCAYGKLAKSAAAAPAAGCWLQTALAWWTVWLNWITNTVTLIIQPKYLCAKFKFDDRFWCSSCSLWRSCCAACGRQLSWGDYFLKKRN